MVHGFAQQLKAARLNAGLSQRELAVGICSTSLLSRLEAGTRQPSLETVRDLAARLGVKPSQLTGELVDDSLRPRVGDRFEHIERLIHGQEYARALVLSSQVIEHPADPQRRARALHLRARAQAGLGLLAFAAADLERAFKLAQYHQHIHLAARIAIDLARLHRLM